MIRLIGLLYGIHGEWIRLICGLKQATGRQKIGAGKLARRPVRRVTCFRAQGWILSVFG